RVRGFSRDDLYGGRGAPCRTPAVGTRGVAPIGAHRATRGGGCVAGALCRGIGGAGSTTTRRSVVRRRVAIFFGRALRRRTVRRIPPGPGSVTRALARTRTLRDRVDRGRGTGRLGSRARSPPSRT